MYDNKLPQGAPTSGYISNIVMREFDEKIGRYCNQNSICYTRYSDDMSFSGDFDVKKVANYNDAKVEELRNNAGIIRHK